MESLYGLTKGTKLEQLMKYAMQCEANAGTMYYSLACLAKEQGLDEVAEKFIEAGNQEIRHSGFYGILNGIVPQDFWARVEALKIAEYAGEKRVLAFSEQIRKAGLPQVADEMVKISKEEAHHGDLMQEILEKYHDGKSELEGKILYACPYCGYIHIGDINEEDDDYVCPLCGQPKRIFQKMK